MEEPTERRDGLIIDCGECAMQGTEACDGCVVSFVLERREGAVVLDVCEERAVRAMTRAGLLPLLRWEKRTG